MPTKFLEDHRLDARPDRIDLRDREYRPPLRSLPIEFPDDRFIRANFSQYKKDLILNQGSEGACTGFGLAAAINFLLWREAVKEHDERGRRKIRIDPVSPRMLYHLARMYDEWPEEDYEGSSCRGAMKGWHHHGVCREKLWPYRKGKFVPPLKGWQEDAATRPLGAYYRIDKDSLTDLQSAVCEVGAIYVSCSVHRGWMLKKTMELPLIQEVEGETGGHAFAIVGYNQDGFIVQNSWGHEWGFNGFAVLTYPDWFRHATDAWVAVLGAPVALPGRARSARSFTVQTLQGRAGGPARGAGGVSPSSAPRGDGEGAGAPFEESTAYEHTIVMANEGVPVKRLLHVEDAAGGVREVAYTFPLGELRDRSAKKLAIYAHGGLNDEPASIRRIRIMGPYFEANGIYPLFLTWRTGFIESLRGIIEDAIAKFLGREEEIPAGGVWSKIKDELAEVRDRTIEVAAENLLVKAVWAQMKQNAEAAARPHHGLQLLADCLDGLKREVDGLEIHLVGHSAGSLLLGFLLDELREKRIPVTSCSLYAPACTLKFALDHYKPAIEQGIIATAADGRPGFYLEILSDEREREDSVGCYGKSLLYLVSRALEDFHKMPLLGMQAALERSFDEKDTWNKWSDGDKKEWGSFAKGLPPPSVCSESPVHDGVQAIPLAHGSFDNDLKVVASTLRRIKGGELNYPVTNLHGF